MNAKIPDKLRVLIVAPSFDILGGQSVQAARLLEGLKKEPSLEVGFLPINPRLPGILRQLQRIKYVRTIVTSIAYVWSLLLRVYQYDVVHVFSASYFSFVLAPTPAILIGKLYRRRVLLNYHSGEAEDHLQRWRRTAIPTIRLVDSVVVPSEYLVRVFASFGLEALAIYNIIDTSRFRFRERVPLRPVFLSNRNLENHYGVDRVLRAFAIIQQQVPEASLTIAGDGSQLQALKNLGRELGLQNTSFIGQVNPAAIADVYNAADIFLNGSEIDNQPLSILEAFSCGLPIVTTDAGGIPDVVHDGQTGMVVKRGDYAEIAKRSLALLHEPALAKQLVGQGRNECAKYSWDSVRDAWLNVYRSVHRDLANEGTLPTGSAATQSPNRLLEQGHDQMKGKLQKLRRMSLDELRVRGAQAFSAYIERQRWSRSGKVISDDALLGLLDRGRFRSGQLQSVLNLRDHFRERTGPGWFASFDDPPATTRELRKRWPQSEKEIVTRADRIVAGRFDLLAFRDLSFGTPIDWHLEPIAGKRAPLQHWSRVNYLDAGLFGDKKVVWELNRHQYFLTLGQTYWLTNDERYAETVAAHLSSWMDQNPPKLGMNWASSLEVAFRSISWLWALYFFKDSAAFPEQLFAEVWKFLYLNARHLETYLSTYFSPNTHLTGEALGLFYLGTVLPEFKESARWRNTGQQILLEQLNRQVQADGVYFEQSTYYHRYTTDFYLHLFILLLANKEPAAPELTHKLCLLLDHLMYITRPDGTTPLVGDDDGGRLLDLDRRRANDFRAALSTGAALFERSDYKFVAGSAVEETLWLLGPAGLARFDQVNATEPEKQSIAFATGGYYVLRDGWTPDSNCLIFDCGPHGADNCGHAHADALAFDLAVKGKTVLIDPGTYTYTGSRELRDWFRISSAHNALTVDRESSSVPDGPFSWKTICRAKCSSWITTPLFDYVEGSHDGYVRLRSGVHHTRSVLFLKGGYWVLRDQIDSPDDHLLQAWFHFDSHAAPLRNSDNCVRVILGNSQSDALRIMAFSKGGKWSKEAGWVSHCYGEKTEAPVFTFSAIAKGSDELVTFLLPEIAGAAKPSVRAGSALHGRAFEINFGGNSDLLLLRHSTEDMVETVSFTSDFAITWMRFADEKERLPRELVLISGQTLMSEGRQLVYSPKPLDYLVARQIGDGFSVETENGVLATGLRFADLPFLFPELDEYIE
jgi:glycosyltransferase involved in cell wall biosynthesis